MDKEKLKELKKWITENYGKQCKDFNIGCYVCQVWLAYDILDQAISIADVKNKNDFRTIQRK